MVLTDIKAGAFVSRQYGSQIREILVVAKAGPFAGDVVWADRFHTGRCSIDEIRRWGDKVLPQPPDWSRPDNGMIRALRDEGMLPEQSDGADQATPPPHTRL